MYFAVNPEGQFWNGFAWSQQGKEFLSIPSAVRSLHEEGEDTDLAQIVEVTK